MSVPPSFQFFKDSFFSIGLPAAENVFYQLSEEELKKQTNLEEINQNEIDNSLPELLFVKEENNEKNATSSAFEKAISENDFSVYYQQMIKYLDDKPIWIRNSYLIAENQRVLKIRHISELPKDDLFILKTFSLPAKEDLENFEPDWYFINTPDFISNSFVGTNYCIVNFTRKVVLMAGVSYSEKLLKKLLPAMSNENKNGV